jgi:hypothetical protein
LGTEWTVRVDKNAEDENYVADCAIVIDCRRTTTAPKIVWSKSFYPRTDKETDFACVAGVRNVYWITEHAPNEFCVAGWQETTGGNADVGE